MPKSPGNVTMEDCKECELAIYCYSESSTWIFRTKEEMEEKRAAIDKCPCHQQVERHRAQQTS
jgi:hypothetical protein